MTSPALELLEAAEAAVAHGRVDLAIEQGRAALAEDPQLAGAHHLVGKLLYVDDEIDDAQHHLEHAFRYHRASGQHCAAVRVAIDLAGLHAVARGHAVAARGWTERARVLLHHVGPCVEWGYLELAVIACDRTDTDDLLASTERALAMAVEFADADLEAQAMADRGLALVSQGRTAEGFAGLDAALAAIAAGEVNPVVAGLCYCSMLAACDRAGDLQRAQEWTTIVGAAIAAAGDHPRVLHTHCRVAYGSVLCAAGRWSEAETLLLEALGPPDLPYRAHRALTAAHLAGLRIEQGRIDEAAELLAPFEDRVTSCGPLAEVHARRGEPALAAAVLRRGLRELVGDVLRTGPLLAALVEIEVGQGDLAAAQAAAQELAALADRSGLPVLRAEALRAEGRRRAAEGDYRAALAAYDGAQAALGAETRPLLLAAVRIEHAELLAAAGQVPAAVAEARAALAGCERLGAIRGRDRAAALLRSLGDAGRTRAATGATSGALTALSPREREVLDLVRQGLTNAEIGERLYISAKTAEHHVGRILAKLGVRSRAEAAALAVRLAAPHQ